MEARAITKAMTRKRKKSAGGDEEEALGEDFGGRGRTGSGSLASRYGGPANFSTLISSENRVCRHALWRLFLYPFVRVARIALPGSLAH